MLAVKFVANRIRLFLRFFLAKVWLLLIAVIKPGLQVSHKFSYAEHTLVIFKLNFCAKQESSTYGILLANLKLVVFADPC